MNKQLAHSKFEYIVAEHGSNIAIEYAGIKVNYRQLNSCANKVANALLENGLTRNGVVASYFESSIEYVSSVIGINKAGGAFMPLQTDFPVKRLVNLLNDVNPSTIVTHPDFLSAVTALLNDPDINTTVKQIITLNFENGDLAINTYNNKGSLVADKDYNNENINVELDGNDSNYIIYTSGSTGQPKIIEGCHKGLSHFIHWEIEEFRLTSNVRVSQLTPLSFDVSFRDIFTPLLAGGTLVIPENGIRFQPRKLLQWLISSQINLVHCVPTLFRLLTEELKSLPDAQNAIASLKFILLAGEPLFGKDVLNWRAVAGNNTLLVNIYGPSETTLAKMFHRITETNINPASIMPLGKAISNTAVLILNDGKLCQIGKRGNIYIKTPFRSKGYFKNEELTREKFIQNPLHHDFEDIIYDTGDTGKYLENMDVLFLGRNDNQVKIRGNRIELLEVETVLVSFPGIKGVAVVVISNETADDAVLACYYTGNKIDEAQVKNYLNNYLSVYMHPSFYIHLTDFPLNSSGKIDKKALPKPDHIEKDNYEPPVTETERKLENIWKEILKVPKVSRNESFFNIGGSSLKGIKIISKIYKECGVLIKLPDLFINPTIKQLGALLAKSEQKLYYEIKPVEEQAYYELSPAQRRLWILSHFDDEHVAYNLLYANKFTGNLQVECLNRALQTVVTRHESMRTVFVNIDGEPKQKIISAEEFKFELDKKDLRNESDPNAVVRKIADSEVVYSFDLVHGPLVRAKLLYLPNDEYVFIFSIHHIITDGWSANIWMKEIIELYNAYKSGEDNPLKPLKIQYKDFAAWQNNLLNGIKLIDYQSYWKNQFTPLPPVLEIPADKDRPKIKTYNGGHYGLSISKEKLEGLKEIGNSNGSTLFMSLLATINVLLYRLTGQSDITIGTPITGREHEDLEDQIGVYVNTLALRTQFDSRDSFLQVLDKVKDVTSGAYAHQIYPFDYLIDQLNLNRDLSRSPLFDVMIVLHDAKINNEQTTNQMDDVQVHYFYVAPASTKFDININFTERIEGLNIEINYNSDVFTESFMDSFFALYQNLLAEIISGADKPINKLDIIDEESKNLITAINLTNEPLSADTTIQSLFEQQVKDTPDAIAVFDGNEELTYAELNSEANAIAQYLKEVHQVKVEDTVAVLLDRSVDFVAVVLGILKTGAAFVPVDVDYPAERINLIMDSLTPKVVISEAGYGDKLTDASSKVLLAETWDIINSYGAAEAAQLTSGSNLAYVIYTSGSTGIPKGVAVENSSFVNYVQWANKYYFNNGTGHVFAFNTSISFDLTITSIFTTLLRGDKLAIYGSEFETIDALNEIFDTESEVNVVKLTPSHISLLSNLNLSETNVDTVIVGGEMFHTEQVAILRSLNPGIRIFNEYGPTEATVGCIVKEILADDEKITVGIPIANTEVRIADEFGNDQPIGVPGEIYISGAGLARGYYNNETLTNNKFRKNLSSTNAERYYATGDIGKLNADGNIELIGRKDRQTKIRGYRIELEDVESSMLKLNAIHNTYATVVTDEDGEKQIVAYFIGDKEYNTLELRNLLKQYLPSYMIPLYFVRLDEFPLTTNGKLDEKTLPNPFLLSARVNKVHVPPSNNIEAALVSIWESVLNKTPISIDDDFFELGGHSLNATRILSRIFKEMNVRLSLKTLFTYTTIATLALQVHEAGWLGSPLEIVGSEMIMDDEDVYII
jgi:amino acid adenylation domain-containing protein